MKKCYHAKTDGYSDVKIKFHCMYFDSSKEAVNQINEVISSKDFIDRLGISALKSG
jgi:hypothetical protein